jgi:hypothetical protein
MGFNRTARKVQIIRQSDCHDKLDRFQLMPSFWHLVDNFLDKLRIVYAPKLSADKGSGRPSFTADLHDLASHLGAHRMLLYQPGGVSLLLVIYHDVC